jgi:hypothetical protein
VFVFRALRRFINHNRAESSLIPIECLPLIDGHFCARQSPLIPMAGALRPELRQQFRATTFICGQRVIIKIHRNHSHLDRLSIDIDTLSIKLSSSKI